MNSVFWQVIRVLSKYSLLSILFRCLGFSTLHIINTNWCCSSPILNVQVVDLVKRAVPFALTSEDDPARDELKMLQEEKVKIDVVARKQVRRILWSGLGFAVVQVGLLFRLTFWEFSWDVMEPVTFFITATGIVIGYAYFMFTSRDPSYQDLTDRLFLSRQRKLCKKHNFDCERFKELQKKCTTHIDATASIKNRTAPEKELELEDALHRD
ncbi:hypothetical protein I3760_13G058000 [Carya illinoinensis]|nr:hypothetical protein I3760_13G058000 [Carya illinoinensis]